ncbi:MAG: UDP-glucose/GDP-mannose dehydrogenase family protein [Lentisphaerae bacterium]|jgi:UDPglucose 6-dehydrogenase|nr:UDP-glucose/GDP-mannose dehydrogenase family protein [Lentisphaerota bacterium]MBT5612611.1 UDP-glucose/GDP-mannose dehydrogenase family protein [Lentisphaerota bacterium]MBT7059270.1 UDP-glucose/GDP-mannose dehydrogenase family protein [Lentisphaerota bacterium]MBT7845799.1 UDP-glucose/GDP-mannose dehydrogenase family protein [Lentisphaerota bacterium]
MNVSIAGTGYVGLVTGVCLAEKGHSVVCVDVDQAKVDALNAGTPTIFEVGLPELLERHVGEGRLSASTDLAAAVRESDITLIAVGTPFDGAKIDLTYVRAVAAEIGQALAAKDEYHVVVVKSTVIPGTTDSVVLPILEQASGKKAGPDFGVGMNPEFLTEGTAIEDFMDPDRIVLGGSDDRAVETLAELYAAFENVPVVKTNNGTAEMIKYASNALLATLISFSNEFANLSSALGDIDIVDVLEGVHCSRYLTTLLPDGTTHRPPIVSFLGAGCGFGGSCLPKDVSALIAQGGGLGLPMQLLQAVIDINRGQHQQILTLLGKHFSSLADVRVAVLGLAFKPDTDDMRESRSVPIIRELLAAGACVRAYDPIANEAADNVLQDERVTYCETLDDVLDGVDAVVLATRWEEFERVPELIKEMEPVPVFVDGRRMLDKARFEQYEGIGL